MIVHRSSKVRTFDWPGFRKLVLAAATRAGELTNPLWDQANQRPYFRASSVEDFDLELNNQGQDITGEINLFGHVGDAVLASGAYASGAFFIGELRETGLPPHRNLWSGTVSLLHNDHIGANAVIRLLGCRTGAGGDLSIAQLLANRLGRPVFGYPGPMFFSSDKTTKTSSKAPKTIHGGPVYMLPEGGGKAIPFCPGGGHQC